MGTHTCNGFRIPRIHDRNVEVLWMKKDVNILIYAGAL